MADESIDAGVELAAPEDYLEFLLPGARSQKP
jgi:hypothetical protein